MNIRFKDLQIGDRSIVDGYEQGAGPYRARLMSMGLTKGAEITLRTIAPLGDPVEIEVRGYKLSLRRAEADVLILRGVE
jgi:ferrous iron transport protein A